MADFKRGGFRNKFGGGGGKPRFQSGDRDQRPRLHPATCSQCGKACEVPFRPTGERPVFCRDCFAKQGGPRAGGDGDRRHFGPREHGPIGYPPRSPHHPPHHPPHERPPHHEHPRSHERAPHDAGGPALAELKRAVDALGAKIDKLATALEARPQTTSKGTLQSVVKAVTKKAKKASSKKK